MVAPFEPADAKQRRKRDEILVPLFYDVNCKDRYQLLPKGDPLQRKGVDTLLQPREINDPVQRVEEKIINWPMVEKKPGIWVPRQYAHTAICVETDSNVNEGLEKDGWIFYSIADWLFYCFLVGQGEMGMDCHLIDLPALRKWFLPIEHHFPISFTKNENKNTSKCRVVDLSAIRDAGIRMYRYHLWPESCPQEYFCEKCGHLASFGFGVSLKKFGLWYCREHRPLDVVADSVL